MVFLLFRGFLFQLNRDAHSFDCGYQVFMYMLPTHLRRHFGKNCGTDGSWVRGGLPCLRVWFRARNNANARSLFSCGCSTTVSCDTFDSLSFIVFSPFSDFGVMPGAQARLGPHSLGTWDCRSCGMGPSWVLRPAGLGLVPSSPLSWGLLWPGLWLAAQGRGRGGLVSPIPLIVAFRSFFVFPLGCVWQL